RVGHPGASAYRAAILVTVRPSGTAVARIRGGGEGVLRRVPRRVARLPRRVLPTHAAAGDVVARPHRRGRSTSGHCRGQSVDGPDGGGGGRRRARPSAQLDHVPPRDAAAEPANWTVLGRPGR